MITSAIYQDNEIVTGKAKKNDRATESTKYIYIYTLMDESTNRFYLFFCYDLNILQLKFIEDKSITTTKLYSFRSYL